MKGYVHSTESFGAADGPGIRYIIFVSGCNFRCRYCHNPDTWNMKTGTLTDSQELIDKALRYKSYWGDKGGITVSGGEPMLQPEFVTDIFKKCRELGINTCIDTAGQPYHTTMDDETFNELMKYTDLVMLDIKHIDEEKHKWLTGSTGKNVRDLFKRLSEMNKRVWVRYVLLPGINDSDEYLEKTREFIDTMPNIERVDVLPYHTLGVHKWEELGIPYTLKDLDPPSPESTAHAKKILGAV